MFHQIFHRTPTGLPSSPAVIGMYGPTSWFPGNATDSCQAPKLTHTAALSGPLLQSMPSAVAVAICRGRCHLLWPMPSAVADSVTLSVQTVDFTEPQSTILLTSAPHAVPASTAAIRVPTGAISSRHLSLLSAPAVATGHSSCVDG